EYLVVGVRQGDPDLVRSWRQTEDDDRLAAGVAPDKRSVVYGDVEMPDPRRNCECSRAEHRHDADIFGPVLDRYQSLCQQFRRWRFNDELCGELFGTRRLAPQS